MMKFSAMRVIVDRTERGLPSVADDLVTLWPHDSGSPVEVRSSTNFVFRFSHLGSNRYLRFSEVTEKDPEHVRTELAFLAHLAEVGIKVASPIPSLSGNCFEIMEKGGRSYHAVVFEEAPGRPGRLEEMTGAMLEQGGRVLGRIHQASIPFSRMGHPRDTVETHVALCRKYLADEPRQVRDELDRVVEWLGGLPRDESVFGLIHYDFETDNIFWEGDSCTVIDFDDMVYHWYAADVAVVIEKTEDLPPDKSTVAINAFLSGYTRERKTDETFMRQIPGFRRLIALVRHARILRSMECVMRGDEMPWEVGLRAKLSAWLANSRSRIGLIPFQWP